MLKRASEYKLAKIIFLCLIGLSSIGFSQNDSEFKELKGLYSSNQYFKVINESDRYVSKNTKNDSVYYLRAASFFEIYNYQSALTSINTAIIYNSFNQEYFLLRAKILWFLARRGDAFQEFDRLESADSLFCKIYYEKSKLYSNESSYGYAMHEINKAIKCDTLNPNYVLEKINILTNLSRYDEALIELEGVQNIDTNTFNMYYIKYQIYYNLGDSLKACNYLYLANQNINDKTNLNQKYLVLNNYSLACDTTSIEYLGSKCFENIKKNNLSLAQYYYQNMILIKKLSINGIAYDLLINNIENDSLEYIKINSIFDSFLADEISNTSIVDGEAFDLLLDRNRLNHRFYALRSLAYYFDYDKEKGLDYINTAIRECDSCKIYFIIRSKLSGLNDVNDVIEKDDSERFINNDYRKIYFFDEYGKPKKTGRTLQIEKIGELLNKGNYEQALYLCDSNLNVNINDPFFLNLKGFSLFGLEKFNEAEKCFLKSNDNIAYIVNHGYSLELITRNHQNYLLKASNLFALSILSLKKEMLNNAMYCAKKSLIYYKKATYFETSVDKSNCYNLIGEIYMIQNKILKAKNNFKRAVELNPKNSVAYFNLANALVVKHDLFNSNKNILLTNELSKFSSESIESESLKKKNKLSLAYEYCSLAIENAPNFADAYVLRAKLGMYLGHNPCFDAQKAFELERYDVYDLLEVDCE